MRCGIEGGGGGDSDRDTACGSRVNPGGDRGTRTPNLRDANAALSQLSYIPTDSGDGQLPHSHREILGRGVEGVK